ncbi:MULTISPECIES: CPBP family intramembrane glutamic endopeptidase [Gracilibacillus]|uniref:CPBP family intramembrane glutamic endopeptidase n=1 Tax=Gracilibacillus TaxID=74385 RepID=UPI0008257495|nr:MULTISPECIES: CPBP family intramembrane glutamic endopeptidase [Gracilibacillus]
MTKNNYHWITYAGFFLIGMAAVWLIIQNNGMIETSADHDMTIPFWQQWVIFGLLIGLIFILSGKVSQNNPFTQTPRKILIKQTTILTVLALLFMMALILIPDEHVFTFFPILKMVLLLIIPATMFRMAAQKDMTKKSSYLKNNQWIYPLLITAVWMVLYFYSPLAIPKAPAYEVGIPVLIAGTFVSFLINSVLEEFFYRVWLQTRLEALLGTWPAIMLSSLLWAVWHMAIQGGAAADIALANVFVNQGVTGLFLGFLWSKYRNIWVLIMIHGLINLPLQIFTLLF